MWNALSASNNVVITALLVTKLVVARRHELETQPEEGQTGTIARLHRDVIVILVESAAPLTLVGPCLVIGSVILLFRRPGDKDSSMTGLAVFMLIAQVFFLFFGISLLLSFADSGVRLLIQSVNQSCYRHSLHK